MRKHEEWRKLLNEDGLLIPAHVGSNSGTAEGPLAAHLHNKSCYGAKRKVGGRKAEEAEELAALILYYTVWVLRVRDPLEYDARGANFSALSRALARRPKALRI